MNLRPPWLQPKPNYKPMPIRHDWMLSAQLRTLRTLGLMCLGAFALIMLVGCAGKQQVVRVPCDKYPTPPASLMQPPPTLDLIPMHQRPVTSKSAQGLKATAPKPLGN